MISKQPLIVVGMRFRPHYAKAKPTTHDMVCIIREPTNDVNPKAVAVHFKPASDGCTDDNKIGYIRDADLHLLNKLELNTTYPYKITRVCTSYLKLDPIATHKESSMFDDIFAKHHSGYDCSGIWNTELPYAYLDGIHPFTDDRDHSAVSRNMTLQSDEYIRDQKELHEYKLDKEAKWDKLLADERTKQTEKKTMINTNTMRDSFFKDVKNIALDFQSGKLGVITKDGVVVATEDGVSVNPITEMSFTIPAYAMRVAIADLKAGDIIISSGDPVFFVEGSKVGYMTMTTNGIMQEVGSVSNLFFGKNTVMAVKNMFGDSSNGMNPMMMAMMFSDDNKSGDGFDFKKMMLMQMMMGGANGDAGNMMANPMMAMMFMKNL
mgnify:CR=1 FL=1